MEITYTLNLSGFTEPTLRELFMDGAITRHEYVNELNRRLNLKENERVDLILKELNHGKQSR